MLDIGSTAACKMTRASFPSDPFVAHIPLSLGLHLRVSQLLPEAFKFYFRFNNTDFAHCWSGFRLELDFVAFDPSLVDIIEMAEVSLGEFTLNYPS